MKFYRNAETSVVFSYEGDGSQDAFIDPALVLMSDAERDAHITQSQTVAMTKEDVEHARLSAYSDPITGSDRLFAEASRMQLMGEDGFEAVRESGIARYEKIKELFPWK